MSRSAPPSSALYREFHDVADRLHSLAIHLLRRLRRVDVESRLTGPRLSALSVVVFGGPLTLSELAAAEQVKPPTMTRLVQALERGGFLRRIPDPIDGRVTRVAATRKGIRVMQEGRERRVRMLTDLLRELPADELKAVRRAVVSLESIVAGRHGPSR
ncbi:MAG TPA: MarR family transcriptional regulator [Gemmatimonadales bacterium]